MPGDRGLAAAALAVGTVNGLARPGHDLRAGGRERVRARFEWPTMAALLPSLVQRGMLPVATAWATTANQLAQIGGPALGGFLYALTARAARSQPRACCSCCAALLTSRIPGGGAGPACGQAPRSTSLFSGFAFVSSRRLLLGVLSLDLFAVLFGGAVALLPIYARDILLTGTVGTGPAARGAGAGCAEHVGGAGALSAHRQRRADPVRSGDHLWHWPPSCSAFRRGCRCRSPPCSCSAHGRRGERGDPLLARAVADTGRDARDA